MNYDVDADFDAGYIEQFGAQIDSLSSAQEDVVLNLSGVSFVDSCGIGALVSLHKRLLSRGHRLKVMGLRGQPLQLLINLQLVPLFCA
ncbi:MAG: STAS domain-containing protein [Rhodomicrobium sp.]